MDDSQFDVLETPIKSESDKKDYKVIKLKNELVACLISDPTQTNEVPEENEDGQNKKGINEKKAAAMLCIGVGSYSNPKEVQGMAHFLEHMVFMGSEKFPTENDFGSFISKRGGTYNAFTMDERTCFFFECLEKHFKEALDKFAQFFIAPLVKKESMTREREAVDSEFQMSLVSDYARQAQIFLSLANEDSPVNSFSWGNLKTLKNNIDDDELHGALHEFRKRYYSANMMCLAVQSRLSIEDLENLVLKYFSDVPNNYLPKNDFTVFTNDVYNTEKFNKIYYIKPIDATIDISLSWCLPSLYDKYKTKSLRYLCFLLGDEGKGSLLSYLKKQVWATSSGVYNDDDSIRSIFICQLQLTEEGFNHLYDVIEAVFSYINLIKQAGPQEYLFEDLKTISDTAFKFATEDSASLTVIKLEEWMHIYPPEHFLTGSQLYYEFDPQEITMILDNLTPSKINIMVANKNLPDGLEFNKTEKWFGTEYTDVSITEDMITKWESIDPYPEFEIPSQNPFITKDFTFLPELPNHPQYPEKIIDTDKCELWYRQDQKFKLPFAHYNFYLVTPFFMESPKNSALTSLYTILVSFCLDEELYPAEMARLSKYISFYDNKGINISVEGYNEKLPVLIEVMVKYIININDYITEKMFLGVKDKYLRDEYNIIRSPYALADNARLKLLIKNDWTSLEKYNELLTITYEDMKDFIQNFKNEMYVKVLVQGNVSPDVACHTVNNFLDSLEFDPLPESKYPNFTVSKLPIGEKCLYLESFNKNDSNSITSNYYQVGSLNIKDNVILDIIMLIMEAPVFDILRTKEQLGYSVYCNSSDTQGILGYFIGVMSQAHKFSTDHLNSRIEAFVKNSQKILDDTNDEDFQHVKEDYIKGKECVDIQLSEEVGRNWNEIINEEYIFDRTEQEVQIAKEITIEEIRNWWEKHNHFGGQENYRKISLQVAGHVQEDEKKVIDDELYGKEISWIYLGNDEENPGYYIENIDDFRDNLEIYPPKPLKKGP